MTSICHDSNINYYERKSHKIIKLLTAHEWILSNIKKKLYTLLLVIPRRQNFVCQRFGTFCRFHLHKRVGILHTCLLMKMEQTECSETLAYKIQIPGNYQQ